MAEEPTPLPTEEGDDSRRHAREAERIAQLRTRLYSRGTQTGAGFARHDLNDTSHTTARGSFVPPVRPEPVQQKAAFTPLPTQQDMPRTSSRRSFRTKLVLLGAVFLVGALGVSSAFLFLGNNTISGTNIGIDVSGPIAVGGGEVMNMQIAIANQNSLPIESATLIIDYPRGAQSVTEPGKELFSDRLQLNNIQPNEVINVPIRLLVFGEQNDSKEIGVSVEYRVRNSNATFYKEAPPFEFKIDSSPIVMSVNAVENISSGQETDVEIVIQSNAQETLNDLILKVSYPQGFDFTKSVPDTASGQDTWKLKPLKPGEEQKIKITGVVVGSEKEEHQFDFTVGVANERDTFNIVSPLAVTKFVMSIERPFLEVEVMINGSRDEVVVVEPSASPKVVISFTNALDSTVYDGVIRVELGGNALSEIGVRPEDGHYDSSNNTITWDAVAVDGLRELAPGDSHDVSFTIDPDDTIDVTPEIKLSVSIQGNRVGEDRSAEQVIGTIERTIKIASTAKLTSSALYSEGPFTNSGPTPPVAEKTTQYTYLLAVKNGTNPVTGAEVTAVMPQYMTWLDMTSDDDAVSYNSVTRTLKWDIGEINANEYKEVWVQVAFKPSLSQVDLTPTILESQRFRATDRFTGTVIRTDASALTTHLSDDPDSSARDGRVRESE